MDGEVLSVGQYLALVNETLGMIPGEKIVIEGEVAEFSISHGKWVNFSLKDEKAEAKVGCFMTSFQLKVPLENGLRVQVQGYPKVYEKFGKFSLNVQKLELVGAGALAAAYEMLKKRLAEEGLFDVSRKREIPRFPHRIGLITSTEAAAYGDFMRILNNRWSGVEVIVSSVHVQGQFAVPEILEAFAQFAQLPIDQRPDVIVLTRGGGSLEDLHAFNDESVARAVFQSAIPVVCGVGHERDESLCDFVADVRASTPSNAAERVVPDQRDINHEIDMMASRFEDIIGRTVERKKSRIDHAVNVIGSFISVRRHEVERAEQLIRHSYLAALDRARLSITSITRLFESFDVKRTLSRGFAIVRAGGKVVKDAATLAPGAHLNIQLAEGELNIATGPVQDRLL